MARGAGCCCCCFSNHVRYLIRLLTVFVLSSLFANLVLFNFTANFDQDLAVNLQPVGGLESLQGYTIWHDRRKREANTSFPNVSPVLRDSVPNDDEDEGHPILPSTTSTPSTTTTARPTPKKTEKPRVIYITNSPTAKTTTTEMPPPTEASTVEVTTFKITTIRATTAEKTDDVVLSEVEKALAKLKEAENNGGDKDMNNNVAKNDVPQKSTGERDVTKVSKVKEDLLTRIIRTLLYAAPGIGVFIGILPAVILIRQFGVRRIFSIVLILSTILTFVTPIAVPFGFPVLLSIRILQGILFATVFPVIGSICVVWAPLHEQLSFIAAFFVPFALGPLFSWPFARLLQSNEVPFVAIYSIHAAILLFLAFLFIIFYRDRPQYHPWVNGLELNRIVAGKVQELQNSNRRDAQPCSTLIRSISAWSIWFSATAFFILFALCTTFIPSFLFAQDVFYVEMPGRYSVLSLIGFPVSLLFAGLVNYSRCSSSTAHVRIWNTVAFVFSAIFVLLVPISVLLSASDVANDNRPVPLIILSLCLVPLGFVVAGFLRSLTLVGRFYSQHIVAYTALSFALAYTLLPVVVNLFVTENKLSEWVNVFFFVSGALIIAAIEFAVFGRGRSASWAERSWDPLAKTKMNSLALIDYNQDECGLYELRHIGPSGK